MSDRTVGIEISADDFVRRFSMRVRNLMWFLGAGASAAGGIPTAGDMVWEFKQQLFVSQRRVSRNAVSDLSSAAVRSQLQAHIDSLGNLPSPGSPAEYAALFEEVFPSEIDRHAYLEAKVAGAKPSYGHLALATLMRAQLLRLVWTTNFDRLITDACARVYGATGALTSVALDTPDLAVQRIVEERWPIEIKLHGDFQSRRLKNTNDELRHQDSQLRQVFSESCRRFGIVIVGYSGRDDSIMDALEEPLSRPGAFPSGLFWLHRGEGAPLSRVSQLLARAQSAGVEVAFVNIENFDEVLRDALRLMSSLDTRELEAFALERRRWSEAPVPRGKRSWPVIRLNALPVVQMPSVCRRVICSVGGFSETRSAVEEIGVDVLTTRTRAGVLAFGVDAEVRRAFEKYSIVEFGLHDIETKRLRYESSERGLLREALTCAMGRHRDLATSRHRSKDLLWPANPQDATWTILRQQVGALVGIVKGEVDLQWHEGIATRLDWGNGHLWLLVEPRTIFEGITDENRAAAADFARERSVRRYNKELNDLIAFWASLIAGDGGEIRALGIQDGIDAVFRLSADTAFSWRSGA